MNTKKRDPIETAMEKLNQARKELEELGFACASFYRAPGSAKGPVAYLLVGETNEDVEQARQDKRTW
jgi:hypothetical protein